MKPIFIALYAFGAFCWASLFIRFIMGIYHPDQWFIAFMLFLGFVVVVQAGLKEYRD